MATGVDQGKMAIRRCHINFSPDDLCCHGNDLWDKIDYNSALVKDNCSLFAPTPYFRARGMQWCHVNFSREDPCCHGNQPGQPAYRIFSIKRRL